jgi:hypothetical protein
MVMIVGAAGAVPMVPVVVFVSVAVVLTAHGAVSGVVRLGGPVLVLSLQRGASHNRKVKPDAGSAPG